MILWSSIVPEKKTYLITPHDTLWHFTSAPSLNWERLRSEVRHYVNYIVSCDTSKAVTKEQVKESTDEDPALQALKRCIHQGWIDTKVTSIQEYKHVFHELTTVDGIVLRGDRIVVPAKLRQKMIETAHEGHQGKYGQSSFWGHMYGSLEWTPSQSNTPETHREPLKMTEQPDRPWGTRSALTFADQWLMETSPSYSTVNTPDTR